MATLKTALPMGNNGSRNYKTFAQALKSSGKHLLLSTTYGFNSSFTKKIIVGLGIKSDNYFEPIIKLINNSSKGVILTLKTWSELANEFDTISEYFDFSINADAQWYFDQIALGDCKLWFTTAHGERAIRIDPVIEEQNSTPENTVLENEDTRDVNHEEIRPLIKRRKLYSPSIVMQKATFDRLKSVYVCVDERVRRLQRLAASVNECKQLCIEHIAAKASRMAPKDPSIQTTTLVVQKEFDAVKESIKPQMNSVFKEHYFDIVLLEFVRLFPNHIAFAVEENLAARKR